MPYYLATRSREELIVFERAAAAEPPPARFVLFPPLNSARSLQRVLFRCFLRDIFLFAMSCHPIYLLCRFCYINSQVGCFNWGYSRLEPVCGLNIGTLWD